MEKLSQSDFATYRNHRTEPYFTFVKNGQKIIEGRLRKDLYQFIKPGDHIIVCNNEETDSIEVLVKDVRNYASAKEILEKEPFKKLLPDIETIEQGVKIYQQFYTDEQQKEFGMVAIEVERL